MNLGRMFFIFLISFFACEKKDSPKNDKDENFDPAEDFSNPIRPGADPWFLKTDYYYYHSGSDGNTKIFVNQLTTITGTNKVSKVVWTAPPAGAEGALNSMWGATLHFIQEGWYIYVSGQTVADTTFMHQRMWVLKADTEDPLGTYTFMGEVLDSGNERWAIDGNVLERSDGSLFFVWSGITDNSTKHQSTFISKMHSPTRIDTTTITQISYPTEKWETSVRPIQEGQRPLYVDKNGKTILMFSANASWTDEYCLGSLTNTDGDFLNPLSWVKSPQALFSSTSEVFGPGGASYVKSPDGSEDWIVYHAAISKGSGWSRNIRTQKFTWDEHMNPLFGTPEPTGKMLKRPSGEREIE